MTAPTQSGWVHSYADLGAAYATPQQPTPVSNPRWLAFNHSLADTLAWPEAWRATDTGRDGFAGNQLFAASLPVATAYAGHQFGSYNPRLGDGRAVLLGEWLTPDGDTVDIQLKGAGPTPYSRGGDGRSPVGPVVREYLVSEAMAALGVPTTRALAAVFSGDTVYREVPEPGAILTRVASSHLRIGTVQYFAMTQQGEGLAELVDYIVARHYSAELAALREQQPDITSAAVLLQHYGPKLAALVAHWQSLGFVHGVLNTDNMLLCAETVDYGPCAFMDHFDPAAVFSSIDTRGRYAWPNQPQIAHWNFSVLAQCLLPLLDPDQTKALAIAQAAVDAFPGHYVEAYRTRIAEKFALPSVGDDDQPLVDAFFEILAEERLDLTLAFRWLTERAANNLEHTPLGALFTPGQRLLDWCDDWHTLRQQRDGDDAALLAAMAAANPCVIPRNHQIAAAIAAAEDGDTQLLETLNARWAEPYQWHADDLHLAQPPTPQERVHRTFCGT